MNWHKLVYTSHFLDDLKNQKARLTLPFALDSVP